MEVSPSSSEQRNHTEQEERIRVEDEVDGATPVVSVSLSGATPLLWRAADLRAVRGAGLVGALVGALPRQPRQNCRLGRPLQLGLEELHLLEETGRVALRTAGERLLEEEEEEEEEEEQKERAEQHKEQQEQSFREQSILALEDRRVALLRAMTDTQKDADLEDRTAERLRALDRSFTFPRSAMAVQLSTARAGLAHGAEERGLIRACGPQETRAPESRYLVFRDLRHRGFYLTSAGKFGGDFLVYPGDPLRFHAHFIAVCLAPDDPVPLLDVLAVARLGSNVKKTVLLCSPQPGAGQVLYSSLQWSGMV